MNKQVCLKVISVVVITFVASVGLAIYAPDATQPCVRVTGGFYEYNDYSPAGSTTCQEGFSDNDAYLAKKKAADDLAAAAAAKAAADKAAADAKDKKDQQAQQQQPQQQPQQPQQAQQQPAKSEESGNNKAPDTSGKQDQVTGSGCGGGTAQTDFANEGKCDAKDKIKQSADGLAQLKINNKDKVKSAKQKYESSQQQCVADQAKAAAACKENMSSQIIGAQNQVAANTAAAPTDTTHDGAVVDANNNGTQASGYDGLIKECTPARSSCISSCEQAINALKELKQAAQSAQCSDQNDQSCKQSLPQKQQAVTQATPPEEEQQDMKSVSGKKQVCEQNYATQLAKAQQGKAQALANQTKSNNAANDTHANGTGGAASANKPTMLQSTTQAAQKVYPATAPVPPSNDASTLVGVSGVTFHQVGVDRSPASELEATPAAASEMAVSKQAAPSAKDSIYRQYLPGGAKDPSGTSGSTAANEITGSGAKNNWEKSHERYKDLQPSLLVGE